MDILTEIFTGGAKKVFCVRLGNGGTKGTIKLKDSNADTPIDALTMTAKSEGDRALSFTIRNVLGDAGNKEFIVYENSLEIEKIKFAVGNNEAAALAGKASKHFRFELETGYTGDGILASVTQVEFPKGTNPIVTNESYSNAFTLLEPFSFNAICLDTCEMAVHTLLSAYIDRIYKDGNILPVAVISEPITVEYDTRLSHAKSFNNYNVVYVGCGTITTLGENRLIAGYVDRGQAFKRPYSLY